MCAYGVDLLADTSALQRGKGGAKKLRARSIGKEKR